MLSFPASLTRAWTALYTLGLPGELRDSRRDEIESDLWEQRHAEAQEGPRPGSALHVLLRLVLGAPADIVWRAETGAAVRSGKDPDMRDKPWTVRRVIALAVALIFLPIPVSVVSAVSGRNAPGKEETSLTTMLLSIGANLSVLPIGLGLLTIFWQGFGVTAASFGEGSAEIVAGLASFGGLYLARTNIVFGLALIASAAAVMAVFATWALPAVIVGGVLLVAFAAGRWLAPTPPTPATA